MILRVVSGGQSGADLAGLRAARRAGIETGGFAPRGWLVESEDGRSHVAAPWLADWGLVECPLPAGQPPAPGDNPLWRQWVSLCYVQRRKANVRDSDASLLFGDATSPGSRGLIGDAGRLGKPYLHVAPGLTTPGRVGRWLRENPEIRTVNIAGNRESSSPGIGARVERFLDAVFRLLKESP